MYNNCKRNPERKDTVPMSLIVYRPSSKLTQATGKLVDLLKEMRDVNTACIDRLKCKE